MEKMEKTRLLFNVAETLMKMRCTSKILFIETEKDCHLTRFILKNSSEMICNQQKNEKND